MKRRIWLVLCLGFVLCLLTTAAFASDNLTFTADTVNAAPGEMVEVPIRITNNPGVAGIRLEVSYSSDLELVIDELIEADDEYSPYGTSFQGGTDLDENDNPVVLAWAKAKNVTKNTTFATLTFRVAEKATPGLKTVELSIKNAHDVVRVVEDTEENVPFDLVNGGVMVEGAEPIHVIDQETFNAAVAAASPGDTVTIEADITGVELPFNVEIDLNGHTLTATAGQQICVTDTSEANTGLLKIEKIDGDPFVTDLLPAWDSTESGYRFLRANIRTMKEKVNEKPSEAISNAIATGAISAISGDTIRMWFRPEFEYTGASTVITNEESGVTADVPIEASNGGDYPFTYPHQYWNTFFAAKNGWFYITISGISAVDGAVTITPQVRFGTENDTTAVFTPAHVLRPEEDGIWHYQGG